MRLLLQSDIVVWIGVGYVIFVYGLLFSYARRSLRSMPSSSRPPLSIAARTFEANRRGG